MPKDTRKINSAVRLSHGRGLFITKQEDEFEAVVTVSELISLTETGHIEGFEIKAPAMAEEANADEVFEIPTETQLGKMSKAQLVAVAEKAGVSVTPDAMTNKQIIEAILAK